MRFFFLYLGNCIESPIFNIKFSKKWGRGQKPAFFLRGEWGIVVFFDVGWTKMAGKTSIGV
jgi:hypothetical protein